MFNTPTLGNRVHIVPSFMVVDYKYWESPSLITWNGDHTSTLNASNVSMRTVGFIRKDFG